MRSIHNVLQKEISLGKRKIKSQDLVLFIRQWLVLLQSRLPMEQCFVLLSQSGAKPSIRLVSETLGVSIQQGMTLSKAFESTGLFPSVFIALIQTGEESGNLVHLLQRYSANLEIREKIRKKIQTAMIYPLILTITSIVVVTFLLLFVLPSFVTLFEGAAVTLPATTKLLLWASQRLSNYGLVLLIFILIAILLAILFFQKPQGKKRLYQLRRRLPLFGTLQRDVDTAHIASLLALFYEGNLHLLDFFDIVEHGIDDPLQQDAFDRIGQKLQHGESLSTAFRDEQLYTPIFIDMLSIGEESGQLSEVTSSIADYLDLEVQIRLERTVAVMEPALILILSAIVGFIVLAIASPMFQMVQIYDL